MLETARPFSASATPLTSRRGSRFIRHLLVATFLLANAAVIVGAWLRHGHLADTSPSSILMATGQLAALMGTFLVLMGLLFVARTPFLENLYGDKSARYHRFIGLAAILLIALHVVTIVAGYALADGVSPLDELTTQVLTYPYMLAAAVAVVLFLVIGASSIRPIRRRLSYETWMGIHLYAYLAVVLAFAHQLADGSDFSTHPLARIYWFALYGFVFGMIAVFRVAAPIVQLFSHRFHVERLVVETSDVVSIYIAGRRMDRVHARAGQYFRLRLLVRNEWWRSHPFSISAVPDGSTLRFTVKALGDFSERLQALRPGARVMLEGPYGALTTASRTRERVALIGAGIGVTPVRALFEELAGRVDVRLIYRASRPQDLVFVDELGDLERRPDAAVTYVVGRRGSPAMQSDPLSAPALRRLVPDIAARDVYLCGPQSMMAAVKESLRQLGVPRARIHAERFA
jgi:predicted ferric reductase